LFLVVLKQEIKVRLNPKRTIQECSVVIIGSGVAALCVTARLPPEILKVGVTMAIYMYINIVITYVDAEKTTTVHINIIDRLTVEAFRSCYKYGNDYQTSKVIDRRGCWLPRFLSKHKRIGSRLVRTPMNVNPSADPASMRKFADEDKSQLGRTEAALPGFVPLPTVELFEAFCREKLVSDLPASCRGAINHQIASRYRIKNCDGLKSTFRSFDDNASSQETTNAKILQIAYHRYTRFGKLKLGPLKTFEPADGSI